MRYSLNSRASSGNRIITIAARMIPSCEPMPPSTTMARMIADSMKVKDCGLTRPWRAAKKLPAKPAKVAPRVKAESLITVGFMPSARQTISSSRRASQARPIGMRSRRLITNSASRASSRATR
ncbi:hypothetical protein D3C86_1797630 [compost metagenome]